MNELDKEIAELKEFIGDLKTDRAAQKDKEKRESWTKYTSMSLVFIAVLAAIATQRSGSYSSRTLVQLNNSTYYQAQASDQWNLYQANSVKRNLLETLPLLTSDATISNAFTAKITKYNDTQKQSSDEAKRNEKLRDDARAAADNSSKSGGKMGLAVSMFQISIALGSICLVTRKRWLWYLALALATAATAQMTLVWMSLKTLF